MYKFITMTALYTSPGPASRNTSSNETIDERSMEEAASGAAGPGDELPIPMLHVNFSSAFSHLERSLL